VIWWSCSGWRGGCDEFWDVTAGCGFSLLLLDAADAGGVVGPGSLGFEVLDGLVGGCLTCGFFGGRGRVKGAKDEGRGAVVVVDGDLAGEEVCADTVVCVCRLRGSYRTLKL
jgi:hypothetical protein